MLHRRLSLQVLFLICLLIPSLFSSIEISPEGNKKQSCKCFNGGTCPENDKYIACTCLKGFVGTQCQTEAIKIQKAQKQVVISQNYSYFYFEPTEVNYFQISLKVCLPQNEVKKLTNLIFLQVQRSSGKLKLQPSIYQTSPISFEGRQQRCQTFYTHFIPIRKKLNDQYQKIVFGVAIKNNSDSAANRWVSFLQKSLTNVNEPPKTNQLLEVENDQNQIAEPQVESQKIKISCTYQLYLVQNYWGTAIIIMSAITLFISTGVFLYTIRNKYTYTLSNQDILRLYAINPQQFAGNQSVKNDLSHFRLIMPILSYQLLLEKQKRAHSKFPNNFLKRRIQMHLQHKQQSNQAKINSTEFIYQTQSTTKSDCQSVSKSEDSIISIQNVCTICLINFQKTQNVRQTPCKHIFHAQCIDNWCQNTLNCPICRHNLQMPHFMTKRQFHALIEH